MTSPPGRSRPSGNFTMVGPLRTQVLVSTTEQAAPTPALAVEPHAPEASGCDDAAWAVIERVRHREHRQVPESSSLNRILFWSSRHVGKLRPVRRSIAW